MSFSGKSLELRLRQVNRRFASVTGNMKNVVSSLSRSFSGFLQKNYSPPPAPPTTPDLFSDDDDVVVADLAEIALESTSLPLYNDNHQAYVAAAVDVSRMKSNDQEVGTSNKSVKRKVSQPIPIPKISGDRDHQKRAERKERSYI